MKKEYLKLKRLIQLRKQFANLGDVWSVQSVNYEIARIARKLKLDYYSI